MANNIITKTVLDKLKKKQDEVGKTRETSKENDTSIKSVRASDIKNDETKSLSTKEALDGAKKIKEEYESGAVIDAPSSLGLEKIEVINKSDNDIVSEAKKSLEGKYNASKDKTNESFSNKINSIIESNKNLISGSEEDKQSINLLYDKSIKETENQALKRGLARSSIIISEISSLEGSRANELSKILTNLETNLKSNEEQIKQLSEQKDKALETLDLESAIELDSEITKLTEKYQKAREDAIKFNNNVEKLEAEYKLDLDKQKQSKLKENLALEKQYGVNYQELEMKQKQFDYLKNYLDTLDRDYALNLLLTNKEFKQILGNKYSNMYKYISEKD